MQSVVVGLTSQQQVQRWLPCTPRRPQSWVIVAQIVRWIVIAATSVLSLRSLLSSVTGLPVSVYYRLVSNLVGAKRCCLKSIV